MDVPPAEFGLGEIFEGGLFDDRRTGGEELRGHELVEQELEDGQRKGAAYLAQVLDHDAERTLGQLREDVRISRECYLK